MNTLFGRVRLSALPADCGPVAPFEVTALRCGTIPRNESGTFRSPESGHTAAMVGYLLDVPGVARRLGIEVSSDVELVVRMYERGGLRQVCELDGLYTIFLFDSRTGQGHLLQDPIGSFQPVYHARTDRELLFSTSLKRLLAALPSPRRLNLRGCHDYLYNGLLVESNLITSEETLIEGVFKVVPGTCVEIDGSSGTVTERTLPEVGRSIGVSQAMRSILDVIDRSIESHWEGHERTTSALALSAGYDSNYTLHRLRGLTDSRLHAFTVGGRRRNEIPVVERIVPVYANVEWRSLTVDDGLVERLPDIVWRLEGYLFQSGVFLQYELARMLAGSGAKTAFLSDGADQFTNWLFFSRLAQEGARLFWRIFLRRLYLMRGRGLGTSDAFGLYRLARHVIHRSTGKRRYYGMLDYIVKKSGLLVNGAHVQGLYPHITRDVRQTGMALGLVAYQKRFYKRQVRGRVDPRIAPILAGGPGTTDVEFLFARSLPRILGKVRRSSLASALVGPRLLAEIVNRPDLYWHLAVELFSLELFEALFVSGDHDGKFDQESLDLPLESFLA